MNIFALFLWTFIQGSQAIGAERPHDGGPPWTELLFSTINFVLFAYILRRFLKEPVQKFFRERRDGILKSLQDASQNLNESQELLQQAQSRLERVDQEIRDLKEEVDRELGHEREKLVRRAREAVERIRKDAAMVAEQEVTVAKQRLRLELAEVAIEGARALLPQRLTADAERRIADEFISGLEVQT